MSRIAKPFTSLFSRPKSSTSTSNPNYSTSTSTHTMAGALTTSTTTAPNPALNTSSSSPTIIEIFQSQSCSSCPPSNANLLSLVQAPNQNPNILFLSHHVTYWNHLSHTDTFSFPAADSRQYEYVRTLGLRSAYTPMVVVNGSVAGVGNRAGEVERLVKEGTSMVEDGGEGVVKLEVVRGKDDSGQVVVRVVGKASVAAKARKVVVTAITYDQSFQEVYVPRGENRGRTLPHVNVVKGIEKVGETDLTGRGDEERVFVVRRPEAGLRVVVLVQEGEGGRIVRAMSL